MAMNALSLYVTTTRMIFQSSIEDNGAWADINRLVLYLRQALTCCVCGKLLTIPMSSTVSSCQHHVCKSCVGGKMRLKPSCSWCKDHSKFIENTQLRILLQCYNRLCEFMMSASMHVKWGSLTSGSVTGTNMSFAELVQEGADLHDKYNFSEPPSLRGYSRGGTTGTASSSNSTNSNQRSVTNSTNNSNTLSSSSSGMSTGHTSRTSQPQTIQQHKPINVSNVLNGGANNISNDSSGKEVTNIIRSVSEMNRVGLLDTPINSSKTSSSLLEGCSLNNSSNSSNNSGNNISVSVSVGAHAILTNGSSLIRNPNSSPAKVKTKRRGCRCGLATPNPGKLTCCGQRCPCYVDGKGCFDCKCRGCRNPHKSKTNNNSSTSTTLSKQSLTQSTSSSCSSVSQLSHTSIPITVNVTSTISPTLTSSIGLNIGGTLSPNLSSGSSLLPISNTLRTINIVSSPGSSTVEGDNLLPHLPFPKLDPVMGLEEEESIVSDGDMDS